MAAEEKLLVVVGIHEGRGFPPCPGHQLVVEARLSGESLQSDPVDHGSGGRVDISTELAWEMSRKALQEHKLQRTPIRLVCLSINHVTKKKQEIGYVLLDLRSAQQQIPPQSIHWYGLLRCQYAGKRPELRVSLTVEQDSSLTSSYSTNEEEERKSPLPLSNNPLSLPPMILDEKNGWYIIGSPTPLQNLHTVSLTLSHPHNLHGFSHKDKGPYLFKYTLLGNEITTEEFTVLAEPTDFHPERASVRIKGTSTIIKQLLLSQPDLQIIFCNTSGDVLCIGTIPIKPLASNTSLSITCSLNQSSCIKFGGVVDTPTVNATLTLQKDQTKTGSGDATEGLGKGLSGIPDLKSSVPSQISSSSNLPHNKFETKTGTAKRNLTQSLEEASNTSSNSSSSSITTPTNPTHKPPHTPPRPYSPTITTPTVLSPSKITFTSPKTSPLLMSNSLKSPGMNISPKETKLESQTKSHDFKIENHSRKHTVDTTKPSLHTSDKVSRHQTQTSSHHHTKTHTVTTGSHSVAMVTTDNCTTTMVTVSQSAPKPQVTTTSHSSYNPKVSYNPTPLQVPNTTSAIPLLQPSIQQPPLQTTTHHPLFQTYSLSAGSTNTSHTIPDAGPHVFPSYQVPITTSSVPLPVVQANMVQQQMEYQAAMELEMWKMTQEQAFKKELKDKEETQLKLLGEEFQKRDKHREELVKQKIEHYQSLEEQLEKTLSELEVQRQRLKSRELELNIAQKKLKDDRKTMVNDVEQEKTRLKADYNSRLEIDRLRSKELTQQLERSRKHILELEERLAHRNIEFDTYRDQIHNKSESRLQAELGILQLEKSELQHKLEAAVKSKQHYKEQWSKTLKEVATLKQREQSFMKNQLRKQQLELETMREKYLQAEEQQILQKQLSDIKHETQRLQAQTLAKTQHYTHLPPPPPSSLHPRTPPRHDSDIDTDIARWIEERNILLQTGVYTHSDPTIQKLDKKIRDALNAKSSLDEQSS